MRKILILLLLMALLAGCTPAHQQPVDVSTKPNRPEVETPAEPTRPEKVDPGSMYGEAQLMCEAASLEEAEDLAELYGITLMEYSRGVACFRTEEDPQEVVRRGKENGWPELVLNRTKEPF